MIVQSITDCIGKTPMIDISSYFSEFRGKLIVKLESFNPGGSVKDRIAYWMIKTALDQQVINSNTHIIEPTSGNTGIGLAMVCAALGLKLTLVMPDTMTVERRQLIQAYGAKLVLTPGASGMKGSIAKALEISEQGENTFIPMQFDNPANPAMHRITTAREIIADTEGRLDVFVAGVGTGGTLTGVASELYKINPDVRIIAVEPSKSPMISQGIAGPHKIYGIGAGFIPNNLDTSLITEVKTVEDETAREFTRLLAKKTGILVGISSGAAFSVAYDQACMVENLGKTVVVILPDTGERYLSSGVFDYAPV